MKIQNFNQNYYNPNYRLAFNANLRIDSDVFKQTKPDEDIKLLKNINSVLDSTTDTRKDNILIVDHDFIKVKDNDNKEFIIKVPNITKVEIVPMEKFDGKQGTYNFDDTYKIFEDSQNFSPKESQKLLEIRKNLIGIITKVKILQQEENLKEHCRFYDEFQVKLLDILQNIADENNMDIREVVEPSRNFLINHKETMVASPESIPFFTRLAHQTTQDYLKERTIDAMYEYRQLNNPKKEKPDLMNLKTDCCADPNCPHHTNRKLPF